MEPVKTIVSRNIKGLRALKGVTQEAVANAVDIDPVTFRYYEAGKRYPKPEILDKLASYFQVPHSAFFEAEGALSPSEPQASPVNFSTVFQTLANHSETIELLSRLPKDSSLWDQIKDMVLVELDTYQSEERARKA